MPHIVYTCLHSYYPRKVVVLGVMDDGRKGAGTIQVPIVVAEIRLLDWIKRSAEYGSLLISYCTSTYGGQCRGEDDWIVRTDRNCLKCPR